MKDIFKKGEIALLAGMKREYLLNLDGGISKLKGARGGVDTSRIIDREPGDKVELGSHTFILLRPDIRDHIDGLERGAQIIIPKDAAAIIYGLGLGAGSRVAEAGAGSGGLTLFLLNSVTPGGRVYTYELRNDHLDLTRSNVSSAGLDGNWKGKAGDIYQGIEETSLDAFVLDVPEPEKGIGTAVNALRPGGRFCAYVPTTNQLEKEFLALEEAGFQKVESFEITKRPYSVKKGATRPVNEILSHTGFLIFARWMGSP